MSICGKKCGTFVLAAAAMVMYFGYVTYNQEIHLIHIEREHKVVEERLSAAQNLNQELLEERNKLTQADYVEKVAREELGMVRQGEVPYISGNGSL